MGSGSSKPKASETSKSRPDKVSKVQAGQVKSIQAESKSVKVESNNFDQKNKNQWNSNLNDIERVKNDKNIEKSSERTNTINSSSNANMTKTQAVKLPSSFESDSDSEGEDINTVLAATRAENTNRAQQSSNRPTENLPETYAQRLQRQQYAKAQQDLFRQKTIYRNPDEWDMDEREDTFDVSKFKEANVAKPPENPVNRDIFSPPVKTNGYQAKIDRYSNQSNIQRKEALPRYDTSEEALLAEIEQQYDL